MKIGRLKKPKVLELKGIYELLLYTADANILGDNTDCLNKIKGSLFVGSKEVGMRKYRKSKYYIHISSSECMTKS
jgi:hypothetical protein